MAPQMATSSECRYRWLRVPRNQVDENPQQSQLIAGVCFGVTSTVTDRVMDADDENFMKTSKDAQARSGAMLLTWNN